MKTPSIEEDSWALVSAEERQALNPLTFEIPPRSAREQLIPGDAAQLLFDIETKEAGRLVDRGVDRMWVIVKRRTSGSYVGVLDNDPGAAEGLSLGAGQEVSFGPEHVAAISKPPRSYIIEKYGPDFFES